MLRILTACTLCCFALNTQAVVQTKTLRGVIQELDATAGTITVRPTSSANAAKKTFSLSRPDLPVTDPEGKSLNLQDLKIGHTVYLSMPTADDVTAIRLALSAKYCVVARLDLDARQLEVKVSGGALTYALAKEVQVLRSQRPVPFSDVKPGMRISVEYLPGTMEALVIRLPSLSSKQP